jgi:tRNA(Ile)-lysidine synthase
MAIVHCNFQLRGFRKFYNQNFVQEHASNNNVPFFTQFDTAKAFADDFKNIHKLRKKHVTAGFTKF